MRLQLDPLPLDNTRSLAELQREAGETITAGGLGGAEALRIFTEVLAPACITASHPRFLAFIPCAPTEASMLFDLVVGASSMSGSNWLEAAGAVYAENQALRGGSWTSRASRRAPGGPSCRVGPTPTSPRSSRPVTPCGNGRATRPADPAAGRSP